MQQPFATARIEKRQSRRQQADAFLWQWLGARLAERTTAINRVFKNVAIIAPTPMLAEQIRAARPDWTITATTLDGENHDAIIMLGLPTIANDVPALLAQTHSKLQNDGLFLCGFYGGSSWAELRTALLQAESEISNGAAARVAPMIDASTAAALLQRAQFALPVIDHETAVVTYENLARMVADLREANAHAVLNDTRPMPRLLLPTADAAYRAQFVDARGRLAATLQGLFLSGWKS